MTVTSDDTYTAGTGPGDFLGADLPPEPELEPDEEAPYGWTRDRQTGELRPKLRPGRPKHPPTADELRAGEPPPPMPPDQAPRPGRRRQRAAPAPDVPMPAGGIIATGVNRLYRRAGRIVRAMDHDIGSAIIECTKPDPDDPDFVTVGQAWENLAKTSPRIRRVLLNLIRGGTWQDLILAHAPIGLAIMMKPWIQRLLARLPLGKMVAAWMSREDEEGADEGGEAAPGGMTEDDVRKMATRMGMDMDEMAERAAAHAAHLAGPDVPAGLRRQQPRNRSRAARRK